MLNLFSVLPTELESILSGDFPSYRNKQLTDWIYKHFEFNLEKMTNIPKDYKQNLTNHFSMFFPETCLELHSKDGSVKYRLKLQDDQQVETVLIPGGKKNTLCISSQVGCARKCSFCSTAKMGMIRNLSVDEIVTQILHGYKACRDHEPVASNQISKASLPHITNLVFMGMGEPMDNIDNVLKALQIIQSSDTLAFSPRRTTVSTCGVVPGIVKLADSGVKTKLAISLNSAIDAKRDLMMPINKKYPLNELKQSMLYYLRKSSFRITIEYILIAGENMGKEDLNALRKFVGDIACKINFIPLNPGSSSGYTAPTTQQVEDFMLQAQSLPQAVTLRRSRGTDVFGACGQLRINQKPEKL